MSDPVTNAEIEDVLSSIRRLVSEDPDTAKRRRAAEATGKGAAPVADKLVLTPALRVEADVSRPAAPVAGPSAEERSSAEDTEDAAAASLPATEPPMPDPPMPDPPISEPPIPGSHAATSVAPIAAPMDGDAVPETERLTGNYYEMTLEQRIAELEAAIGQTAGEWEPDGSEDADDSDETRPLEVEAGSPFDGEIAIEDVIEDVEATAETPVGDPAAQATDRPESAGAPDSDGDDPGADGPYDLDAYAAAVAPDAAGWSSAQTVETNLDPAAETADPENAGLGAMPVNDVDGTHETHGANDARAAASADGPAPDPEDAAPAAETETETEIGATPGAPSEDDLLDEAALRAIVADLVREELQGVLGERITRNVRRLVRQELQKALAVRDLD